MDISNIELYRIVGEWKTVDFPLNKKVGSAEIIEEEYEAGEYFPMEEVDGYWFFTSTEAISFRKLLTDGDTAMVDDPLHWLGMQRLAEASEGKVAVGGLGLGLIVHHLVDNPKVTQIDVIEINPDVIELIKPTLPKDERIRVFKGDAFKHDYDGYDTIIYDLITSGREDFPDVSQVMSLANFVRMRGQFNAHRMPIPKVFIWGVRDPNYNPAVKPSKGYMEMMNELQRMR